MRQKVSKLSYLCPVNNCLASGKQAILICGELRGAG